MATASPIESARGHYVLLVDDDPAITAMYRFGLEHDGFRVREVEDAESLFRAIAFEMPDLLVLDWSLPGLNGGDILEKLRRSSRTRFLPVIMLSNFPPTRDGAIDRVFRAGAIAWLEKVQTTPADLSQKLGEALRASVGSPT